MVESDRLERSTLEHEGFRAQPYLDSRGLWTLGIGKCLQTNPLTPEEWKYLLDEHQLAVSITREGAAWLMRRELLACERRCRSAFDFWGELNDARQNVLCEMAYQMGIERLRGFKKMLASVRGGDFETAADHGLDSKWARADSPLRAQRLMKQLRLGLFFYTKG